MSLPFGLRLSAAAAALLLASACSKPAAPDLRLPDFASLVEEASPSVVNISTVPQDEISTVPQDEAPAEERADAAPTLPQTPESRESLPDWMKRFLEKNGEGALAPEGEAAPGEDSTAPQDSQPGDLGADEQESLGSGFVLWEDGYIITNAHVVKNAREVLVRLSDRRELPAEVIGMDEPSDLALLKIDAKGLAAVRIGDVSKLRAGEWVMAIGSPFGFDYSVTSGIVSAKGRNLFTEQYVPFIQTDAAINPGNSGGPLFNLKGEVIGVNSQIYSQTGGNSGIAFAIPIDVAVRVATQLKEKGRVVRGWLGVEVQALTRELTKSFGLAKAEGALVARVVPGSPAERSGLKAGDVIMAFNDNPLPSSRELPPLVGGLDPGSTVPVQILRDGKKVVIKVEIGELPTEAASANADPDLPQRARLPLGLAVRALTEDERKAARVSEGGVVVLGLEAGPAQDAGVRPGDIVLTIQGQQVDSIERLKDVAARLTPGTSVPMLIQRNGGPLFLAMKVPGGEVVPEE